MSNDLLILIGIAVILGLGMISQWLAWRFRLPSIILLLLVGLGVGPVATMFLGHPILDVELVLGDLLFPVVSASVAIILFEGGLGLRISDIRGTGAVVRNLVSIGVFATWAISAVAARFLFAMSWELALLLGATLVVTGPTVIIPLIKQIRPKGRVGSILRWEGIVIDPIGAVLAVLVFEDIIGGPDFGGLLGAILITILIGGIIGWITAQIMIEVYRRYWVPDTLQNPVTLGFVLAAFTVSNVLQSESGLVTVTIMGIVMANQHRFDLRHIIEFKETLQVLLLSSLFILLAARMTPADISMLGWPTFFFVLIIIFIERPLAVWLSTWGSALNWREKLFLAWMAPRGIVAASVASIFALELQLHGPAPEQAALLVPITFAVIIGTVATYSLTAGPLARSLGLAERNPQGVLIVGGSAWIRAVASAIQQCDFRVLLADTNQSHANQARSEGLDVFQGNILSELAKDEIDLVGIGRLLALTGNEEVNALAGEHFRDTFGGDSIYEIQRAGRTDQRSDMSQHLGGRVLFPKPATYEEIERRFRSGANVMTVFVKNVESLQNSIPNAILPLFAVPDSKRLIIWTATDPPRLQMGMKLIALIEPQHVEALIERGAITIDEAKVPVAVAQP